MSGGAQHAGAPRMLIVRLSALGDVVMASGLIAAIRAVHPQAHLAWLVEPAAAPLLRGHPGLDELVVWPRDAWRGLWRERRWAELWREVRALRARLRAARFDLAIDAQGLLKSGLWCRLSGAPRRISLLGREGSAWLATERLAPTRPEPPAMGWEYRALARHLGAPESAFRAEIALTPAARAAARAALDGAGVGAAYAVLAPFTTRAQKHWFDERWVALADALTAQGLTPVLLGGPGDTEAAARIAAQAPQLVNLVGKLKLDQSAAAIAAARLLVGVDTGLTHIGSACGVPTVALFGSTRPYLDARAEATRVLYQALPCSPCGRHPICGGRFDCMRQHTPATVSQAAREVLRIVPADAGATR
jgi:heptosyltransferase-1